MLFQPFILLTLSLASIQAQPMDRRDPGSTNVAPTAPATAETQFQKVMDCVVKELKNPVVALGDPPGETHTPAAIAFDKCVDDVYRIPDTQAPGPAAQALV